MEIGTLILILEVIGIFSYAISGSFVAIDKEMDCVGVLLLAIITCFGGGVTRDLILGIHPPLLFSELLPLVLLCVCVSAAVFVFVFIFKSFYVREEALMVRLNNYVDAVGLGSFAVAGVQVCLAQFPDGGPFLAISMGVISAVGGGMIRDVCIQEIPFIFKKRIYLLATLAGSVAYYVICYVLCSGSVVGDVVGSIVGVVLVFLIRVLATTFKWNMPKAIKFDELDKW